MTKYLKLFMVAIFATLTLSLTACGDDDEPSDGNLVGTWMSGDSEWGFEYNQFKADGSFVRVVVPGTIYDDILDEEPEVMYGKWSRSGNTVTFIYDDGDKTSFEIEKITSDKLYAVSLGIRVVCQKVPDSVIDKYL